MYYFLFLSPAILLLMNISLPVVANASNQQDEAWLEDHSEFETEEINEGQLNLFLPQDPQALYRIHSIFTITPNSLSSGWLLFHQCHYNLDPVPRLEVSYQYREIQQLRIIHSHAIKQIRLQGQSVQLEQVAQGGHFCIEARVKLLQAYNATGYQIHTGPFFRRFLDGYYPLHVVVEIEDRTQLLRLDAISPQAQPGLTWESQGSRERISLSFVGRLFLTLYLSRKTDKFDNIIKD